MDNIDRYLAVVNRARKLFSRDGILILSKGGIPSIYTRVERLAWEKYMLNGNCGSQ